MLCSRFAPRPALYAREDGIDTKSYSAKESKATTAAEEACPTASVGDTAPPSPEPAKEYRFFRRHLVISENGRLFAHLMFVDGHGFRCGILFRAHPLVGTGGIAPVRRIVHFVDGIPA